jgi:hypothetical protein
MDRIEQASFIERRARALATVLLTGRDDLMVMDVPPGSGVDLLVSVLKQKRVPSHQFGIILKGTTTVLRSPRDASRVLNAMMGGAEAVGTSIPLCIFLFNMTGNDGFDAWQVEPALVGGMPKLRHRSPLVCEPLDEEALREIVDRVDAYYEALSRSLAV